MRWARTMEQDVVLTQDDVPIIVHDIILDTVTDVAEVFPAGREQMVISTPPTSWPNRQLKVHGGSIRRQARFHNRFPLEP